jgi:hypothetical protein
MQFVETQSEGIGNATDGDERGGRYASSFQAANGVDAELGSHCELLGRSTGGLAGLGAEVAQALAMTPIRGGKG